MTQSVLSRKVTNLKDEDYEELRKLLKVYEQDISLEKAKKIGNYLLKIHVIVNKVSIEDRLKFKEVGNNEKTN